ncbi:MAG: GNAT family N-acetyltransferase [Nitrosarchaeum sp.]
MKLDYFTYELDTLPMLDFTEIDDSDPLHINEFYKNDLDKYSKNNLSKVWIVKKYGSSEIVAYFTISMSAIELSKLNQDDEKVKGTTPKKYPSMMIGRMGVVKQYRRKCIGTDMCNFIRGLAIELGKKVACRYLILQTNQDVNKIKFYKDCGFIQSNTNSGGLIWMYSRIL